jgi:hypothetical protein
MNAQSLGIQKLTVRFIKYWVSNHAGWMLRAWPRFNPILVANNLSNSVLPGGSKPNMVQVRSNPTVLAVQEVQDFTHILKIEVCNS